MEEFAFYSYLIGLIVFLLILPFALLRIKKNSFVPQFTIAIATSVLWMAAVVYTLSHSSLYIADTFVFETLRNAAWFFFLSVLISRQLFSENYAFLRKSKLAILLPV